MTENTSYANWILAVSNLVGLLIFPYLSDYISSIILFLTISSSTIFHIGQSHNHGLSGIYPLNKYSYQLLFLDVSSALLSIIWFFKTQMLYDNYTLFIIIIALFSFILSGLVFRDKKHINYFVISHSLWHFLAYYLIYLSSLSLFSIP